MELILRPWKLYADPSGRSRRSEYWYFFLIKYGMLFLLAGLGVGLTAATAETLGGLPMILVIVWILASFLPSCMLLVRRCHDFDVSGKLALLTFVPYIGFIVVIVIGCIPGTVGENERGFDPREPDAVATAGVFE